MKKIAIVRFLVCFTVFSGTIFSQPKETSFAEVAKKAEPAVVSIDTKTKFQEVGAISESEDSINNLTRQQTRPVFAVGSGFIVDSKGFIITNAHVVDDSTKVTIRLQNGEQYVASILGTDEETDIAVLKIETNSPLPTLKFGDSNAIQVGEWVLAIGSPFGLEQTVTAGIISKTQRETPSSSSFQKFIQTDAAINRGNSGGPLINMNGDVIGINSQIATSDGNSNGIGFALPSNEANYVYKQILANGKVKRGYLGVVLESVKSEFAKVYELAEAKGAIITEMRDKESPAGKAGLLVGDILIEFDGKKIDNAQDLITKVASTEPEKAVSIIYFREIGSKLEKRTATLKLAERPTKSKVLDSDLVKRKLGNQADTTPFGLTLAEITPQIAKSQSLENQKGLFIKDVSNESIFTEITNASGAIALKTGDVLQKINRAEVGSIKNFSEIVSKLKKGDAVVLHILSFNRQNRSYQARIVQFTVQ
jgi:serine protease Do